MKKDLNYILQLCIAFGLYFLANELWFSDIYYAIENLIHTYALSFFLTYLLIGLPVLLFVFFTNQYKILRALGLSSNIFVGLVLSFVFTIPMFIGYGISANFEISLDAEAFWFMCVFAAFFEELYYRGVFFGQIFRKTRLGFLPSLLVSAIIFASLHMYQSQDFATLTGIFFTTFMGAGLFAWLYVEWNYNLWVPIGLHFFMNLSWEMFDISENALGDLSANLYRGLTILFAVGGTILYKRMKKQSLGVNRDTLFMKKQVMEGLD
jgi:hypothetical protein